MGQDIVCQLHDSKAAPFLLLCLIFKHGPVNFHTGRNNVCFWFSETSSLPINCSTDLVTRLLFDLVLSYFTLADVFKCSNIFPPRRVDSLWHLLTCCAWPPWLNLITFSRNKSDKGWWWEEFQGILVSIWDICHWSVCLMILLTSRNRLICFCHKPLTL